MSLMMIYIYWMDVLICIMIFDHSVYNNINNKCLEYFNTFEYNNQKIFDIIKWNIKILNIIYNI